MDCDIPGCTGVGAFFAEVVIVDVHGDVVMSMYMPQKLCGIHREKCKGLKLYNFDDLANDIWQSENRAVYEEDCLFKIHGIN